MKVQLGLAVIGLLLGASVVTHDAGARTARKWEYVSNTESARVFVNQKKIGFRANVCSYQLDWAGDGKTSRIMASCVAGNDEKVRGPKLMAIALPWGDSTIFDKCHDRLTDRNGDGIYVGSCTLRTPKE
jgi:hypothetical protein